jgi:beta-glucanase (GH16 family)
VVAALLLIGQSGATLVGRPAAAQAAAQDAGAPRPRLDRAVLHPTFAENFAHFAASTSGFVDGRPAWRTSYFGGDRTLPNNHEAQWYMDDGPNGPFRVIDHVLEITAAPQAGLPQGMTHRSGLITSQRLLNQRYGYFEMRARLPRGRGLWPAFWLLPSDGGWPPEIDVMEMLGDAPARYYVSVHARPGGPPLDEVTAIQAPDLSAGFHVFGVSWRPDRIRFYLDDALVHETATPADMHRPMYMLANLAVGGAESWPGPAAGDLSGVYRIAWIRAWQFNDLGETRR